MSDNSLMQIINLVSLNIDDGLGLGSLGLVLIFAHAN